jgi:hypothetical protein
MGDAERCRTCTTPLSRVALHHAQWVSWCNKCADRNVLRCSGCGHVITAASETEGACVCGRKWTRDGAVLNDAGHGPRLVVHEPKPSAPKEKAPIDTGLAVRSVRVKSERRGEPAMRSYREADARPPEREHLIIERNARRSPPSSGQDMAVALGAIVGGIGALILIAAGVSWATSEHSGVTGDVMLGALIVVGIACSVVVAAYWRSDSEKARVLRVEDTLRLGGHRIGRAADVSDVRVEPQENVPNERAERFQVRVKLEGGRDALAMDHLTEEEATTLRDRLRAHFARREDK